MIHFKRFFEKHLLILAFLGLLSPLSGYASAETETVVESYNVKDATFHHLLDNYDWEFWKKEDGTFVKLSLPRILYNRQSGSLDFFASTEAAIEAGYVEEHHYNHEAAHGVLLVPEAREVLKAPAHAETHEELEGSQATHVEAEHGHEEADLGAYRPIDFSISKAVLYMLIAAILILLVFTSVARAYKRREGMAPKGMQSLIEPVIVFVRDEIARPNIGHGKHERFMPLLLTFFFFILFLNLLGMTPFSGNVTGNISVTLALSLVTLVCTVIFASRDYWMHIFWPPVPHGIKPIMVPLEVLSIFTKPFALTIRLFANMTAGHVMLVSLISLVFIFGKVEKVGDEWVAGSPAMGYIVGILSTLFAVAIGLLEVFVAFIQAYVFTMLTAVFIGQSVESHHHDGHEAPEFDSHEYQTTGEVRY